MNIIIREHKGEDIPAMVSIWNRVIEDGVAFPQEENLTEETGREFFASQSLSAVAEDTEIGMIVGLYILHPNNIGRCGHIANSSYAVKADVRGEHIGEKLVRDSLIQGKKLGFKVLQFNAVVATNASALHLYKKIGFTPLGVIPKGFRLSDGTYEDIIPHYIEL